MHGAWYGAPLGRRSIDEAEVRRLYDPAEFDIELLDDIRLDTDGEVRTDISLLILGCPPPPFRALWLVWKPRCYQSMRAERIRTTTLLYSS